MKLIPGNLGLSVINVLGFASGLKATLESNEEFREIFPDLLKEVPLLRKVVD
jgi:hypothetical protein